MSDATVFVAIAFAAVWMKRKQRWKLFFQALEGGVVIGSSNMVNASAATPGNPTGAAIGNPSGANFGNPNQAPVYVGGSTKAQ